MNSGSVPPHDNRPSIDDALEDAEKKGAISPRTAARARLAVAFGTASLTTALVAVSLLNAIAPVACEDVAHQTSNQ